MEKIIKFLVISGLVVACSEGSKDENGSEAKDNYGIAKDSSRVNDLTTKVKLRFTEQSQEVLQDLGYELANLKTNPEVIIGPAEALEQPSSKSKILTKEVNYDGSGHTLGVSVGGGQGKSWSYKEDRIDIVFRMAIESEANGGYIHFPKSTVDVTSPDVLSFYQIDHKVEEKMVFRTDAELGDSFVFAVKVLSEEEVGRGATDFILPPELGRVGNNYSEYQRHFLSAFKDYCLASQKLDDPSFANFDCSKADESNCKKCGEKFQYDSTEIIIQKLKQNEYIKVLDVECLLNDCSWTAANQKAILKSAVSEGADLRRVHQCEAFQKTIGSSVKNVNYDITQNKLLLTFESINKQPGKKVEVYRKLKDKECLYKVSTNATSYTKIEAEAVYYNRKPARIGCSANMKGICGFVSFEFGGSTGPNQNNPVSCDSVNEFWVLETGERLSNGEFRDQTTLRRCNPFDFVF